MLERFDREWNPGAKAYRRYALVSGLTVIDAEDGYLGRERWSYPLLADELRRWSAKSNDDRRELFLRMVFNAMVTNNDDHPRNHALLHTKAPHLFLSPHAAGCRLTSSNGQFTPSRCPKLTLATGSRK